jgi:hypothetical protein
MLPRGRYQGHHRTVAHRLGIHVGQDGARERDLVAATTS